MDNFSKREKANANGETFSDYVNAQVINLQLDIVKFYKNAGLTRDVFSKLCSNRFYQPSKQTAIKVCLGLKLKIKESEYLLSLAGYALSGSIRKDLIIRFCISSEIYNLLEINNLLYQYCKYTL